MKKRPALFGPYEKTKLLCSVEASQPIRPNDLRIAGYPHQADALYACDRAGVLLRSPIVNDCGYALRLNPHFPAAGKLRALLRVLSREYGCDEIPSRVPKTYATRPIKRKTEPRLLFGSKVRTLTLFALEALGGKARHAVLIGAALGCHSQSAKAAVKFWVGQGVLLREGDDVRFAPAPFAAALRDLLRGLRRPLSEEWRFATDIAREAARPRPVFEGRKDDEDCEISPLFYTRQREATLIHLALNGPTRIMELNAATRNTHRKCLDEFIEMGLVIERRVGSKHVLVGLNASHPQYHALRRWAMTVSGMPCARCADDFDDPTVEFDVSRLFGTGPRGAILYLLSASDELDGAVIADILNQHERGNIYRALRRFARMGILRMRTHKNVTLYSLSREYALYPELLALLLAGVRHDPNYARDADLQQRVLGKGTMRSKMRPTPLRLPRIDPIEHNSGHGKLAR